jgi:hypothetical protein
MGGRGGGGRGRVIRLPGERKEKLPWVVMNEELKKGGGRQDFNFKWEEGIILRFFWGGGGWGIRVLKES